MALLHYVALYLLPGLVYTAFLEYYSTKHNLMDTENIKWKYRERAFHILLWPLSVMVFIVTFVKFMKQ